jgi:O-antigen/teichoic acid export membrane protein
MLQKSDNHFKTFIYGSFVSFIGVVLVGIINYFIRRILALNLTQADYGFFYSAIAFINIPLVFIDIGLGYSLTILISKYTTSYSSKKINCFFSLVLLIKSILGIIFCILLVTISTYLSKEFFHYPIGNYVFILLCFLCITSSLSGIINATLNGYKNFFYANLFINLQSFIILLVTYLFINKYQTIAPAIGMLLGNLLAFIAGYIYLNFKYKTKITLKPAGLKYAWHETWKIGKWIAFGLAGINIMYYMDTLMLTFLTDLKQVALYNIALPIMQIFQSLLIFPTVFIPIASTLWHQNKKKQIGELINGFISLITFFCWGISIFTIILGKDIITILFSSKYTDAYHALIILCIGICFFALAQFLLGTLNSIEKAKFTALSITIGLLTNIALNYILIPVYGIIGAATATAISYCIISFIGYIKIKSNIPNLKLNIKRTLLCSFAGIISIFIILCNNYGNYSLTGRIFFTIVVGLIFTLLTIPTIIPIVKILAKMRKI